MIREDSTGADSLESLLETDGAAGDERAFANRFAGYRTRLHRMIRLRLDGPMTRRIDASDIIQETYLDAARKMPEYARDPRAPFYVWLRGIAQDRLLKAMRHHLGAQCRAAGRELPADSTLALGQTLLATATSPSQAAERDELQRRVTLALDALDDEDREILVLRHFEGLTNREIAHVIGVGDSGATMRYGRALTRLKSELARIQRGPAP